MSVQVPSKAIRKIRKKGKKRTGLDRLPSYCISIYVLSCNIGGRVLLLNCSVLEGIRWLLSVVLIFFLFVSLTPNLTLDVIYLCDFFLKMQGTCKGTKTFAFPLLQKIASIPRWSVRDRKAKRRKLPATNETAVEPCTEAERLPSALLDMVISESPFSREGRALGSPFNKSSLSVVKE